MGKPNQSAAPDGYAIETVNGLYKDSMRLADYYRAVGRGDFISVVAAGPPSCGKTYLAETCLPAEGRKFIRVKANANNLPKVLAKYSKRRFVLYLDECDYIFTSEPLMNLLKLALNPHGSRVLKDDNKGINCPIHCGIALSTNKPLFDPNLPTFEKGMHDHINGLKSRFQLHCPMSFSPKDAYHYTCWLATDGGLLRKLHHDGKHMTLAEKNELMLWWSNNYRTIDELSPRRLLTIAEYWLKMPVTLREASVQTFLTHPKRGGEAMEPWIIKP